MKYSETETSVTTIDTSWARQRGSVAIDGVELVIATQERGHGVAGAGSEQTRADHEAALAKLGPAFGFSGAAIENQTRGFVSRVALTARSAG